MNEHKIEVIGIEPCDRKGQYGDTDPWSEQLRVSVDGDEQIVPITDIHKARIDYYGKVPTIVSMDMVWAEGDELHAHTVVGDEGHYVELYEENGKWGLNGNVVEDDPENYDWEPDVDGFTPVWTRE